MATLTLNINAQQAEIILKNLKGTMEGVGRSTGNLEQKVLNLQDDLKRGFQAPGLSKLQGSTRGLAESLKTVKAVAETTAVSMIKLVTTGNTLAQTMDKATGGQYRNVIATEASLKVTKLLDAQYSKHAGIIAEITMLEKGYTATMAKAMAIDEAKLAISKLKTVSYITEANALKVLTISQAGLTAAMAAEAAIAVGAASRYDGASKSAKKLGNSQMSAAKGARALAGAQRGAAIAVGQTALAFGSILPLLAAFMSMSIAKKLIGIGVELEYLGTYITTLNNQIHESTMTLGEFTDQLLNIKGVANTPAELALGVKELVKAGIPAAQAISQIKEASHFAAIAEIEMADATGIAVTQWKAWNETTRNGAGEALSSNIHGMTQAMNALASVALSTKTTVAELGSGLSYTTELSTLTGVSFYEVVGALGALADIGITASKAGQSLRTSMLKMQHPTSQLSKSLVELGVDYTALTKAGDFTTLLDMFERLDKATAHLTRGERSRVLVEMFGKRAIKAGGNIANLTEEVRRLTDQARDAGLEAKFITETYDLLAKSVTIKWKELVATFERSLAKAGAEQGIVGLLEELNEVVSSPSFISNMKQVANVLTVVYDVISAPVKITGFFISLGDKIDESIKSLGFLQNKYEDVKGIMSFSAKKAGDAITLNPFSYISKSKGQVKIAFDYYNKLFGFTKNKTENQPIEIKTEINSSSLKTVEDKMKDSNERIAKDIADMWNFQTEISAISIGESVKHFAELKESFKDIGITTKSLWKSYSADSNDALTQEISNIHRIENAYSKRKKKPSRPKYEMAYTGLVIDGKQVATARKVVDTFYKDLGRMAYAAKQEQQRALNNLVEYYKDAYEVKMPKSVGIMMNALSSASTLLSFDSTGNDAMLKSLEDMEKLIVSSAKDGAKAWEEMSKAATKSIQSIAAEERKLYQEIKGYTNDLTSVHKTAGSARFEQLQKYSSEASQYTNKIRKINELNRKAKALGNLAGKSNGQDRKEYYEAAKTALSEALRLSTSLEATEKNGVSNARAKKDAMAGINAYEKQATHLAKQARKSAKEELASLDDAKKKLQDYKEKYETLVKLLNKTQTIKLDTTDAQSKLNDLAVQYQALIGKISTAGNNVRSRTIDNSPINNGTGTPTNNITNGATTNGQTVNVKISLPGSDTPVTAQMTKGDAGEFINQLNRMERFAS